MHSQPSTSVLSYTTLRRHISKKYASCSSLQYTTRPHTHSPQLKGDKNIIMAGPHPPLIRLTFLKPMSEACSLKHCRQTLRPYFLIRPWLLPHIRLQRCVREGRKKFDQNALLYVVHGFQVETGNFGFSKQHIIIIGRAQKEE